MQNTAKTILKEKSIKITKGRIAVLCELMHSAEPLSCEKLFLRVNRAGSDINLSTVYRITASLVKSAVINAVSLSGTEKTLYEYSPNVHRHMLVCIGCSRILPLENCPLRTYVKDVEGKTGFTVKGHNLDLYGYCPDCAQKDRE